jgi:DNA invertase Pin-like site-specific DNA recombinase
MFIRAYLRASTEDQDAKRAKGDLERFARERGLAIAAYYVENESGATLRRPELFRLLSDCGPGDVLLVEQVDRLSRLNAEEWNRLKGEIAARHVRVVALDLPTSWLMARTDADAFTERMFDAINGMLLDMLAAIARKDYEDRRRRQAQGIQNAKDSRRNNGTLKYAGRPEDTKRNAAIVKMLASGQSWSSIVAATGCSRSTLSRLSKRIGGEGSQSAH